MANEQDRYEKLQADRVRDSKQQMTQSANESRRNKAASSKNKPRAGRSKARKALDAKREVDLAKELPFAFTAVDPSEDFIHLLIIAFSLLADLLTIVPAIGSFIAIPFILLVWFFYLLDGHFKKSPARKIFTTGIFQFVEIIFSTLPALSASAFLNYWYYLADKKLIAKEGKKKKQEIKF